MSNHNPPGDQPGFWRLGYCAARAGLSPAAFEAASRAGTIPVEVVRVSARLALVRVDQFNTWLKGADPQ